MVSKARARHLAVHSLHRLRNTFHRLWQFATSKLGLVILAPIAGGVMTVLVAAFTSVITSAAQVQTARANAIESLRRLVDADMAERVILAENVVEMLLRPTPPTDLRDYWRGYRGAAHAYQVQYWEHQLDIERNTLSKNDESFAKYINVVINPSFEQMDICLANAHDAFAVGGTEKARAALSACQMSPRLAALKHCTRDFTHEFDWSALIEHEVISEEGALWSRLGTRARYAYHLVRDGEKTACNSIWSCRQTLFFGNLRKALSTSCGPLPGRKKWQDARLLNAYLPP